MASFIFVFFNVVLPVFIQMGAGYLLQKKFTLNINTLSKVQFYIFIPALLLTKLYQADLNKDLLLSIAINSILLFGSLYAVSWLITKQAKYPKPIASSFINSVCFYNSGNYCIPLVQLLYSNNPFALSIQVIIMTVQNILTNTVGIFNTSVGKSDIKKALINILKVPMAYIVAATLLLKGLDIKIWSPLWNAADLLSQGLVPTALITLGAQLANTKLSFNVPRVYLSNFIRLIISPLLACLAVMFFGLHGIAAQVIIISSGAPTAVNSVLLAIEYDNEPDFAAQAVFLSTVFSALTVSSVIFLVTRFIQV